MEEAYKSFSATQLAGETTFIRWVRHGENDQAWAEWMSEYPATQSTVSQARQIVLDISALRANSLHGNERNELWNKIQSNLSIPEQLHKPEIKTRKIFRWSLVAAAAALALFFWLRQPGPISNVMAQAGEHREIKLPESSQIKLNAGSSITYNEKRFASHREVRMEGEAFFEVTPGSRFTVVTDQGSVTVLGTSFNVIAREGRFEVSCYTGKVKVENKNQDQQLLTPGLRTTENSKEHKLTVSPFTPGASVPEWTAGKFVFSDQPLYLVVEELERQYNVRIHLEPGIEQMRYTGLFESGDLDKALYLITWPLHLRTQTSNQVISIVR